ncbi:MAG: hypothetical protein IT454_03880 [Planctomycetes bacterium]|nr:hypothetical protein [Planctomycetota bacterium]
MKLSQTFRVLALACSSALSSAQSFQTLPAGFDNVQGGAGTAYPQNTTAPQKWQWHYANSNFAQTGPIQITEISIRALSPTSTVSAFDFPSFVVTCSEATTQYGVGSHDPVFANNLGTNTVVVRSGPFTGGPIGPSGGATSTWIPLGLTTPFTFDPTHGNDLIIQIEECSTNTTWSQSLDGFIGATGAVGGNRYGDISSCLTTTSSFSNNEFVPIARIQYTLGGSVSTFCTSGTTTNGCVPTIAGSGTPSASSATPFSISVANVEGQRQGLLFYGVNNTGFTPLAWGPSTSYLCVKPPTQRTLAQTTGGTAGQCNGSLQLDWNAFVAANPAILGAPFASGSEVFAQGWFRDPPSPKTTMLSDGLHFTLAP